ncbi:cell division site-positioning protein MapZ family protein [Enterococcus sp. HY326]|uniref:cell division site-positioning protein MapZ family protein n=1 Tax=Enterococcus sp. HY326 TaxID=2971265 RepID=UPI00224026C7|nr:cell division site-positioning protein MapZ family protein [Enterococcus sp. HY326]
MQDNYCPACGYEYSGDLAYCPICGYPLWELAAADDEDSLSEIQPAAPAVNEPASTPDQISWSDTDLIQASSSLNSLQNKEPADLPEKITINPHKRVGNRPLVNSSDGQKVRELKESEKVDLVHNEADITLAAQMISAQKALFEHLPVNRLPVKRKLYPPTLFAEEADRREKADVIQTNPPGLFGGEQVEYSEKNTVENQKEGELRQMSKKKKKKAGKTSEELKIEESKTAADKNDKNKIDASVTDTNAAQDNLEQKAPDKPNSDKDTEMKETPINDDIQWSEFEEMPIGSVKEILDEDLNDAETKESAANENGLSKFTPETPVEEETEETTNLEKRGTKSEAKKADKTSAKPKKLTAKEIVAQAQLRQSEQDTEEDSANHILAQYMKEHRHEYTAEEVAEIEEEQAAQNRKNSLEDSLNEEVSEKEQFSSLSGATEISREEIVEVNETDNDSQAVEMTENKDVQEVTEESSTSIEKGNSVGSAIDDSDEQNSEVAAETENSAIEASEASESSEQNSAVEPPQDESNELTSDNSAKKTDNNLQVNIQDLSDTDEVAPVSSEKTQEESTTNESETSADQAQAPKFSIKDKLPVFGEKELEIEKAKVEAELAEIAAKEAAAKKATEEAEKAKVERVAQAVENAETVKREKEFERLIQEKEAEDARIAAEREQARIAREQAKAEAAAQQPMDDATPTPIETEETPQKPSSAPVKSVFPERGADSERKVEKMGKASESSDKQPKHKVSETVAEDAISKRTSSSNRKKWIYAGVAAVVLLGAIGAGYAYQQNAANQEQATQESITNAIDDLETQVADYYTDDSQVFINPEMVSNDLDSLKASIDEYDNSDRYSDLVADYEQLSEKVTSIRSINNLFTTPIINGDALTENPLLASNSPITVTEASETDGLSTLLNQALAEANSQYQTLQAAIQAVAVVYADGAVVSGATTEQFNNAAAAVAAVQNQELVTDLLSQLEEVNTALNDATNEGDSNDSAASDTGSTSGGNSSTESDSGSTSGGSTSSGSSSGSSGSSSASGSNAASTPSYSGNTSYTVGDGGALVGFVMNDNGQPIVESNPADIANTTDSAWTWGSGIQEKVLNVCRERGYFSGDNYAFEPALIVDGDGFYNLYRVESNGSRTYLVTVNCKTSWFKGNGPGGPNTRVN